MDSNFSDKLNQILSDPEGMEKIVSLAKTLGASEAGSTPREEPKAEPAPDSAPSPLPGILKSLSSSPLGQALLSGEKERIQLLCALKPYMSDAKRQKLTTVISAMESLETLGSITKLL